MKLQICAKIKYLLPKMRIVSMVPSWTETLIEAGGHIVGRTRFCIHPSQTVGTIPAVGGTKSWELEKLRWLKPDLIILDKEENVAEMGEDIGLPLLVTHVSSVYDVANELKKMADRTSLPKLREFATRYEASLFQRRIPLEQLPGVIEWIQKPTATIDRIVYLIWKNPWMAVSKQTYIGSVLSLFVDENLLYQTPEKYPELLLENFDHETTLLLFSSEPYPFRKRTKFIRGLGFPSAVVDGEKWSWFGVSGLRFLESTNSL